MKVRWTKNSLRLRITPSELAALLRGEIASEAMRLPGRGSPEWRVEIVPGATAKSDLIPSGSTGLRLALTEADLRRLAEPEREGIYYGEGEVGEDFQWFIEKDFPCIHPRALEALETPTETFLPPADFEARKATK